MNRIVRFYGAILALIALPVGAQVAEQDVATTEAELQQFRAEIIEIQRRMAQQTQARDDLQRSLRDIELDLAASDRQLEEIEISIGRLVTRLSDLNLESRRLAERRESMQAQMVNEIRYLWGLRQGGAIRVLLSDQGPERTSRNLNYFRQLLVARSQSVAEYEGVIAKLKHNREQQNKAYRSVSARRNELSDERNAALNLQRERQRTLQRIDDALVADSDRIAKLEEDSARLASLLDQLRNSLAELSIPTAYRPFDKAKDELTFPVSGTPRNRFGARRNTGNLRWDGWLIPASEGSDVKAVHYGRVVYSDWLGGQGLLMILDHGDGWLSLYGQNRSLRAEVGDWVQPGETIAQVGSSGGATSAALYFEIRKDGDPVDPGRWLSR